MRPHSPSLSTLLLLIGYIIGASQVFVFDISATSKVNVSVSECLGVREMYFVAHQDDDLLFMNPDLANSIRAGHCVRTVFLTAGDALSPRAYWEGREEGVRAAYAYMAGLGNSWQQKTLEVAGRQLSLSTLDASLKVSLVFLRLPDGADALNPGTITLAQLWNGPADTRIAPVDGSSLYSKDDLVHTLTLLMEEFQATSIRMQDPATDLDFFHIDHVDHIHAAKFTNVAQMQYQRSHTLTRYRGYNINDSAANLSEQEYRDKLEIFLRYAAHDSYICPDCVKNDPGNDMHRYCYREYFVIESDQGSAVGRNADGRLEAFIIGSQQSSLSSIAQIMPNSTWENWSNQGGRVAAPPVVASGQDGRLAVFMRGTDHTLSYRRQITPNGLWSQWANLGGVLSSDSAVASDVDGRLDVFARGVDDLLYHMWQFTPNGPWSNWNPLGDVTFTGNPAVARNADGRLQIFVRRPNGSLSTIVELAPASNNWSAWASLGGSFASNPTVESNAEGRLEIFVRGADDSLYHASQLTPNGDWSAWGNLGGSFTQSPVVVRNASGRLEVFVHDVDGSLRTIRQIFLGDPPFSTYLPVMVGSGQARGEGSTSRSESYVEQVPPGRWSAWTNLEGNFASLVGVAANADGRLEAFVRGFDANLYRKAQVMPAGPWSDWASLGRPL